MATLGMNLAPVNYWSTQEPFIDRFMTSSQWTATNSSGGTLKGITVQVDAQGNPLGVPAGAGAIGASFAIDPMLASPIDQYVLTYEGTLDSIRLNNSKIISSEPGRIVFEVTKSTAESIFMLVKGMSETDPIHDVHVVRADQVALFDAGEIFNPTFLENSSDWGVLRFMFWGNTIDSKDVSWSTRAKLDDASWSNSVSPDGVPIEVMVRLANEAHSDMWYSVPTKADDEYVQNALTLIRDSLDPSLKLHIEYSNEVWNWAFDTAKYARVEANELWATGPGDVPGGWMQYYGYRSAQVMSIAEEVFGAETDDRVVGLLATQATNPRLTPYIIRGVERAGVGTVDELFSDYAITTYFGAHLGSSDAGDMAKVLSWARSGEAGMAAAFQELEYGGGLTRDSSLEDLLETYAEQGALATQYGLNLVAYEGGVHMTASVFSGTDRDEVIAMFNRMTSDPRMGQLYARMASDFVAAGGTELVVFQDVGVSNGIYNSFGLFDTIYDASSARYDALLDWKTENDFEPVEGKGSQNTMRALADTVAGVMVGAVHHVTGLGGNDVLSGSSSTDMVDGGAGNDLIRGSSGTVVGGALSEADFYMGGAGADTIVGGSGNDHIYGNLISSVAGAVDGADMLFGGGGNDYVQGNAGADTIDGGTGNDRLYGGAGDDVILGGAGVDYLQGNKGRDLLSGGADRDNVRGGADDDTLSGDAGDDTLSGDAGQDMLIGGTGLDVLTGGPGADVFAFYAKDATFATTGANAYVMDEVTDFTDGSDRIYLPNVAVANVVQGSAATVAAAKVWADQALVAHSGEIYVAAVSVGSDTYMFYDMDGVGGAIDSGIKFGNIQATAFTTADFV